MDRDDRTVEGHEADHRGTTKLRWRRVIWRGMRKRCPRCGLGRLFTSWYTVAEQCPHCHLEYESRDGDTWAFMYVTTAGLTGVIIVGMLLFRPPTLWISQVVVTALAVGIVLLSMPYRKGVAIAIHFISETVWSEEPDSTRH